MFTSDQKNTPVDRKICLAPANNRFFLPLFIKEGFRGDFSQKIHPNPPFPKEGAINY
jgi:hypothetical protein